MRALAETPAYSTGHKRVSPLSRALLLAACQAVFSEQPNRIELVLAQDAIEFSQLARARGLLSEVVPSLTMQHRRTVATLLSMVL